ncbi:protein NRT1/ PTR FAMILY 1.2-like isoform X2 [Solanum pennellii]|uniref:Protein NRT1/ PTR FAMILY 1.2-like isoform X2 n=1 Tax=Solanum pennellii TaxID=28526 RepID=A0ABM1FNZ3_SOLPN|nr:protein NRT1/ PTR FAMILY 1.2-like isoform X2 [Solanum pennellii]
MEPSTINSSKTEDHHNKILSHHDNPPPPTMQLQRSKGGLVTMPFIIANEALERVATFGVLPNMTFYLMKEYSMGVTNAQNLLFYWSSATNFLPLIGALIADSYLGRFLTIGFGSIFSLLGTIVLWLTAMIPKARPPPCDLLVSSQACKSATTAQYTILISSFMLMSIGAGGIRPCSLAFGANQFDKRDNNNNNNNMKRVLETYFNWYYAAVMISVLIAMTGIVYLQDHMGWKIGFGVPVIIMFFSAFLFFLATPLYIKQNVINNLLGRFVQVIAVAYKNRKLSYPEQNSGYHYNKGSEFIVPTSKLRFLNKACIIKSPEDVKQDGVAVDSWSLCTVEQVEELKALVRVMPLWSTGIMISINLSQSSFPLLQAKSMDRHITKRVEIPAASFGVFTVIALTVWLIVYDRVILPLGSRIRGKSFRIGTKERMGIGIFFSCMAMLLSGIIEHIRRRKSINQGLLNNPEGIVAMSAMWLVPQHCLNGIAEAFNAIGQIEFYYSELPKSMSSIATAMFGLGTAVANLLASVILSNVDSITKREGKESWVSSNINRGHYENYYWLLAIMTCLNLVYFIVCSWAYGPCVESWSKKMDEKDGEMELENVS